MNSNEAREKVRKLLALATGSTGDESRTAAWIAAKLIVEHQLLDAQVASSPRVAWPYPNNPAPRPPPAPSPPRQPPPPPPPANSTGVRSKTELHNIAEQLLEVLLDTAWSHKNDPSFVVNISDIVAQARRNGVVRNGAEQVTVQARLSFLASKERMRGVLIGKRGRGGGYRIAPHVTRATP